MDPERISHLFKRGEIVVNPLFILEDLQTQAIVVYVFVSMMFVSINAVCVKRTSECSSTRSGASSGSISRQTLPSKHETTGEMLYNICIRYV